jgi:hypothetical protein
MQCGNHPKREAAGTCSDCGAGLCAYCQTVVEGKVYCPSCVEKVFLQTGGAEKPTDEETSMEALAAMGALSSSEGVSSGRRNPLRGLPRIVLLGLLVIVAGGAIYAAIFIPAMWTANIGKEFQEHKYVLEVGRGFATGGDGHRIELLDNAEAKDPTWLELEAFLKNDTTDERLYTSVFQCGDYAEIVHNNAEEAGIRAGLAVVYIGQWDEMHGINAFDTVDVGLVYIDCTGWEWPSPCSADKIVDIEVGKAYIPKLVFPCLDDPYYTTTNVGNVTRVNIHW